MNGSRLKGPVRSPIVKVAAANVSFKALFGRQVDDVRSALVSPNLGRMMGKHERCVCSLSQSSVDRRDDHRLDSRRTCI
jgi:hypothetical protein